VSSTIKSGHYRHYKGGDYVVIEVAKHSETLEPMVVYRPLYGEKGLWVRPLGMFYETVTVQTENGAKEMLRFEYIGDWAGDELA